MYRERMLNYYPQLLQSILELQAVVNSESTEIELLSNEVDNTLNNAYLTTMSESRIEQWETMLGIKPLENSTIGTRRDTIMARIRGQGKLNSELINTIVGTFTGGTANSWVKDNILYVEITPPPDNKNYIFENVEQEIAKKVPAHMVFSIKRNYAEWNNIKSKCATWKDVKNTFDNWEEVLLFVSDSETE